MPLPTVVFDVLDFPACILLPCSTLLCLPRQPFTSFGPKRPAATLYLSLERMPDITSLKVPCELLFLLQPKLHVLSLLLSRSPCCAEKAKQLASPLTPASRIHRPSTHPFAALACHHNPLLNKAKRANCYAVRMSATQHESLYCSSTHNMHQAALIPQDMPPTFHTSCTRHRHRLSRQHHAHQHPH